MKIQHYFGGLSVLVVMCFFQCKSPEERPGSASNDTQNNKVYTLPKHIEITKENGTQTTNGNVCNIFISNETEHAICANQWVNIKPNEHYVFKVTDTMGIALDNGIQLFLGETEGIEVIDTHIQVAGLGRKWRVKLNVPKSAHLAFSILNPGEGDPILQ